ncbi:MAG: Na/Pi cotransporter family protein [Thermovirgaceae bacterium]|nr:Na/Pi cotransporter family protein [Synergistales bacterium]MDI9393472.1 Na/Pi cotransporter family protein [Synergistota bacterium]MDY0179060.1 Na/Pi cotransporter family protein [Synergistaceae bacterium]MDD3133614.1 Na/Pi cotransporter family protein [Synergistales bacterium]MDD3830789.1 Na/Pi cotransporter family protein [Synergistales bacterium]
MTTGLFFNLLGGVGLFLFGIKLMGESLQDLAGDRMRRLISALTSSPVKGVIVGALITALIQSSSATTVMTASFVHAGLMTLKQSVGVIMGAAIGTTITAQLIAFKIKEFALPLIGFGMLFAVFGRSKRQKFIGNCIVGFGLLFVGMQTMENAMSFLRDRQDIFLAFQHHPLLGVLAGTVLTMLVQSSSATVGLTIVMASQGLLTIDSAIPILFGDNIGTTITAVLASVGLNRSARQSALAHVLFKVIGVLLFLAFLGPFRQLVLLTSTDIARQLANAHTIFNVLNTLLFLPFVEPFVRLVRAIIPDVGGAILMGPRFLDRNLISASPIAAVEAVRKELVRMGLLALDMIRDVRTAFLENDRRMIEQVLQTERVVNELTREITAFSTDLMQVSLPPVLSSSLSFYVNGVGDIERIGDHAENLIELYEYKIEHNLPFSDLAMEEFEIMIGLSEKAVRLSVEALDTAEDSKVQQVLKLEDEIDAMERDLRKRHIDRLNQGVCNPGSGVIFIDILSNLERVGDHANNIALIVKDINVVRGKEA